MKEFVIPLLILSGAIVVGTIALALIVRRVYHSR